MVGWLEFNVPFQHKYRLMHVHTVRHSVVFQCGHCKISFVSEQNDANVTGRIFFSNCFEWLSLCSLLDSVLEDGNF